MFFFRNSHTSTVTTGGPHFWSSRAGAAHSSRGGFWMILEIYWKFMGMIDMLGRSEYDPTEILILLDQVKLLAHLQHPNILCLHELFLDGPNFKDGTQPGHSHAQPLVDTTELTQLFDAGCLLVPREEPKNATVCPSPKNWNDKMQTVL